MHPDIGQGAAEGSLGLGNLVFVVGELQVRTAAMDIQRQAQQALAHGRALDMPAWAAEP